jgi:uncharacterized protein
MTHRPAEEARDVPIGSLVPYVLITFGIPWGLFGLYLILPAAVTAGLGEISASHPAFVLAVWSPAIASFVMVLRHCGWQGLRAFLSRLGLWRCPVVWYAYLLVGMPLVFYAGAAVKGAALFEPFAGQSLGSMLAAMAFMLVLGPMEEFGWRGFALPLLQRRLAPLWAALLLGAVWGVWHLPAFWLSGTPQSGWGFMPFLVGSICLSVIVTPLFNAAGGSILLAVLYHFQANNPLWPDAQPYDTVILVFVAAVVIWLNRETMLVRGAGSTVVVPARQAER